MTSAGLVLLLCSCADARRDLPPIFAASEEDRFLAEQVWRDFAAEVDTPPDVSYIQLFDDSVSTLRYAECERDSNGCYNTETKTVLAIGLPDKREMREVLRHEICHAIDFQSGPFSYWRADVPLVAPWISLTDPPSMHQAEFFANVCILGRAAVVLEAAAADCGAPEVSVYARLVRESLYAGLPPVHPLDATPSPWSVAAPDGWQVERALGLVGDGSLRIALTDPGGLERAITHLDLDARTFSEVEPWTPAARDGGWNRAAPPAHFVPPAPFDGLAPPYLMNSARWVTLGDGLYLAPFEIGIWRTDHRLASIAFASPSGLAVARCLPQTFGHPFASASGLYLVSAVGRGVTVLDLTDMADEAFGPAWRTP